ncbi:MAG: glycosyltransferase [Gammaproteobacteria bacterium]|nr:glycosyltransferase [Gammaproteobacteria bacterium]NNJ84753.1 glycosyltransferase [Gammaproteobacteria bacterium]
MNKISVIIEWKNQDLAEDKRAGAMLHTLRDQWLQITRSDASPNSVAPGHLLDPCCEILFVYDSANARRNLERRIADCFDLRADAFALRMIEGTGLNYYQMKQRGAEQATGSILVFLDSDVIPESGWLDALLNAVFSEGVQIVCGNTYIEPTGLLGKAFALGWFFPLRSTREDLECGARCYSNNIAFHRDVFERYPFDPIPGSTRAGMTGLIRKLDAEGIPIHKCHRAQVSHPPPNGLRHLIRRAMAQGRDNYLKSQRSGATGAARLSIAAGVSWQRCSKGRHKTWTRHKVVDVSTLEIPMVMVIICFYYAFAGLGSLMTHIMPGFMTRRLQL